MKMIEVEGKHGYKLCIVYVLDPIFNVRRDDFLVESHRVQLPRGITSEQWLIELVTYGSAKLTEGREVWGWGDVLDLDGLEDPSPQISFSYYGLTNRQVRNAILAALQPEEAPQRLTIGGKVYELREVGDE